MISAFVVSNVNIEFTITQAESWPLCNNGILFPKLFCLSVKKKLLFIMIEKNFDGEGRKFENFQKFLDHNLFEQ